MTTEEIELGELVDRFSRLIETYGAEAILAVLRVIAAYCVVQNADPIIFHYYLDTAICGGKKDFAAGDTKQ